MKNIKPLIAIAFASLIVVCGQPVSAAETDAKNLDTSVNQLIEVKDDRSLNNDERLAKELEARKQVVKDALALSLKEIDSLENSLKAIETKDERTAAFKKVSFEYLESARGFYEEQIKTIDDLHDIDGVKAEAQTIKDYRDGGYNAKVGRISNFLLLNQTDEFIKIAETRWQKIDSDLKKLERGQFISTGYFDISMQKARKYIRDAASLANDAKEQILKDFEAEQAALVEKPTLMATAETENPTPAEITPAETAKPEVVNPKELAEASLTNLKSGYDVFLKISQAVKKILQ
ncbi:MAG: hypothetical protein M1586_00680 [Patescibacteria group bacterium]|nr:hypothetical protein [Patescibacteria group bacterium]MCL5261800.1 hypothetical protein [Patescibacteria group bacterium]